MLGMDCEDDSCLANIGGICTAGKADGCEGYAIGDEEYDEDAPEIDHEYTAWQQLPEPYNHDRKEDADHIVDANKKAKEDAK